MNPERQRIKQLYNSALELEPDRRQAFLQQACSGDESLQEEIERLLSQAGRSGRPLGNAKGVSMHTGSIRFKPGEWKVMNAPGHSIKEAIAPIPAAEPSAVLFQLLGMLIKSGEQIAATNDVLEGKSDLATMQPTTMLALIEQGLKVFTAIYKRVYLSLKDEYEKHYRLNKLYMEEREEYQYGDDWREVTREDYQRGAGVCPYADPKIVSDMQRMAVRKSCCRCGKTR